MIQSRLEQSRTQLSTNRSIHQEKKSPMLRPTTPSMMAHLQNSQCIFQSIPLSPNEINSRTAKHPIRDAITS